MRLTVFGATGLVGKYVVREALAQGHLLYDLVYNPPVTPFLEEARKRGAAIRNGAEMLERQAEAAWAIWQRDAG